MSDTQPLSLEDFAISRMSSSSRPVKRARRGRILKSSYRSTNPSNRQVAKTQMWPLQKYYAPRYYDPFPYRQFAILRYCESISLTTGIGTSAAHYWRANGIFDPNQTGTGHQPYGHDQYASIYNHYQVMEAIITMTPTQGNDMQYGINLTDDTTGEIDFDTIKEEKGCVWCASTQDTAGTTVTAKFNTKSYVNKYQQSALFGASPADSFYFQTWLTGRASAAASISNAFAITITYKVMMWEPKSLGQS